MAALLKRFRFFRRYSTDQHKRWWANRKIDWVKDYVSTWDHPHRELVVRALSRFKWKSLLEVGCASGPNLIRISKSFPQADLGGVDVNPEAVETIRNIFQQAKKEGFFKVNSGDDIMMSDGSTDVVLSDMALIYVGPRQIRKYLEEMKRVCRSRIVLVEFHSGNPLKRFWGRLVSGYHIYNYPKMLQNLGFYDIIAEKIPLEAWPGGGMQEHFAYIISAKK